jgi:DNA repair exonuclease SbcCD nuclease subunit
MKQLIVGDIHAGVNKNNKLFYKTLIDYGIWIKGICQENNIENIVFLGDIFDSRTVITLETLQIVSEFFDILSDFQLDVIVGNHDCLYNDSTEVHSLAPFKNHPNITIHDKVTVDEDRVYCGWGTKLEDIPECKIVYGHFDIVGYELTKGKISQHGFKGADLMAKVSGLCLTGHYHNPQARRYNGKLLKYTGSAYPLSFNDASSTKYVHILDCDTLDLTIIENTISPRFKYIRDNDSLDDIEGHFVSVVSDDADLKARVDALNPLFARQELVDEVKKVDTDNKEIKEFKVVDIEEAITEFCETSLDSYSFDEEDCKKVAIALSKMYIQLK